MYVNISIHDVAPVFKQEINHLLHIVEQFGKTRGTLLVVPDFHGHGALKPGSPFSDQLKALAAQGWEIVLHGLTHLEPDDIPRRKHRNSPVQLAVSRLYTNREGEFYRLTADEARARIVRGLSVLQACKLTPEGFIAPAWLLNKDIYPVLKEFNFYFTTTMTDICELQSGTYHPVPAVSFSSRTFLRAGLSRLFVPLLANYCSRGGLVRLVLHPADARHPATLETIKHLCAGTLYNRPRITIGEYLQTKGTKPIIAGVA